MCRASLVTRACHIDAAASSHRGPASLDEGQTPTAATAEAAMLRTIQAHQPAKP